tara:strand:+ start:753 stop:1235 length:483 start_codon:yes stop_codon:yes gene_type:complete
VNKIRIGNGFDVHKLKDGTEIILCGLKIKHNKQLVGHSDADVGLHSLTDAIFGALGKGDLGRWFPPSDMKWKNVNSKVFLEKALSLMRQDEFSIANMDLTFICEEPKIQSIHKEMTSNLSKLCDLPANRINIKATTSEGLGFTGRGEGIAVLTSVLLFKE